MISSLLLVGALCGSATPSPIPAGPTALVQEERTTEPVRLEASDGQVLFGEFHAPRKANDRAPAVLLVHGAGSDRGALSDLAASLAKRNFAVLRIDLRGHGESATEEFAWDGLEDEARADAWNFAARDLAAAAAWLTSKDGVHSSNLNLVGVAEGAGLVTRHATKDRSVRSLALIEPLCDQLGLEFEEDLAELQGLPITLQGRRELREDTEALLERTELTDYVDVSYSKADAGELTGDARVLKGITSFLHDTLEPEPEVTGTKKRTRR